MHGCILIATSIETNKITILEVTTLHNIATTTTIDFYATSVSTKQERLQLYQRLSKVLNQKSTII